LNLVNGVNIVTVRNIVDVWHHIICMTVVANIDINTPLQRVYFPWIYVIIILFPKRLADVTAWTYLRDNIGFDSCLEEKKMTCVFTLKAKKNIVIHVFCLYYEEAAKRLRPLPGAHSPLRYGVLEIFYIGPYFSNFRRIFSVSVVVGEDLDW